MYKKNITIDIDRPYTSRIPSMQCDNNKQVTIKLVNNGRPIDLENVMPILACKKPDGKSIFNEVQITNAKQGEIKIRLTEQINASVGQVACNLRLIGGDEQVVTSQEFYISVGKPNVLTKTIESTDEFLALNEALVKTQGFAQKISMLENNKIDKGGEILVEQINKNKGKFDQSYMSDELLMQITGNAPVNATPADGTITTQKIANFAITEDKLAEDLMFDMSRIRGVSSDYEEPKNLFDPSEFEETRYNWVDGQPMTQHPQAGSTGFMPVEPGATYIRNGQLTGEVTFWDRHYRFVTGINGNNLSELTVPTIPEINYMRLTIMKHEIPIFDVRMKEGTGHGSTTIIKGLRINDSNIEKLTGHLYVDNKSLELGKIKNTYESEGKTVVEDLGVTADNLSQDLQKQLSSTQMKTAYNSYLLNQDDCVIKTPGGYKYRLIANDDGELSTQAVMPRVDLKGSMSGISSENKVTMDLTYDDKVTKFTCKATVKYQGSGSLSYPKKNYSISLRDPETSKKLKVQFKDWYATDGYHLKANYCDYSMVRNVKGVQIAKEAYSGEYPKNGRMVVDGFPVALYINGAFYGCYTWNLKQEDLLFDMDTKNNPNEVVYRTGTSGWNYENFEYRSDGEESEYNKECLMRFINWVNNVKKEDIRLEADEYIDVQSFIDYWVFLNIGGCTDSGLNNLTYATYDGKKWYAVWYDLDICFGLFEGAGNGMHPGDATVDMLNTDQVKKNPLWGKLVWAYASEINKRYNELRLNGFDSDTLSQQFIDYAEQWGAVEYKAEYDKWNARINKGKDVYQIKDWLTRRFDYLDPQHQDVYVEEIKLSRNKFRLIEGRESRLDVKILPDNANQEYVMLMSDEEVAVYEDGYIKAISPGETELIISADEGRIKRKISIVVKSVNETTYLVDGALGLYTPETIDISSGIWDNVVDGSYPLRLYSVEPGVLTDGIKLDGINAYASTSNGLVRDIGDGDFTIEIVACQLGKSVNTGAYQSLFTYRANNTTTENGVSLKIRDYHMTHGFNGFVNGDITDVVATMPENYKREEVNTYTLTRSRNIVKLYVNGILLSTSNAVKHSASITNENEVRIGNIKAEFFHGEICSVRVYNTELTQEDILYNYSWDEENFRQS